MFRSMPSPGLSGIVDIAVHHLHRVGNDLLLPRLVELVEDLVDEEVGQWKHSTARRPPSRPAPARCAGATTPKCASTMSAILRAANSPPRFERLGLQNADDVVLQQFGELLLARKAFAGSDRHRTAPRHLDHGGNICVRHRLLEPGGAELVRSPRRTRRRSPR